MIKINAEQIKTKLDAPYYLLVGNDPYLQHNVKTTLQSKFKLSGFEEQKRFTIDNQTDWATIYDSCQAMTLFSSKTAIFLDFGDNPLTAPITAKLDTLGTILTTDVALVISVPKITKAQENSVWYKALTEKLIVVNCATPDISQLPKWIKNHLQQHEMAIEPQAVELLCYYYEGNLLALTQLITQLKLLYPNHKITYDQIEANINDAAVFTPYHWVDAMIMHKVKRATHTLQQLQTNDTEPLILLRVIQRELILIINLKKLSQQTPLKQLFDEYRVWQNRRALYTQYLNRFDLKDLYKILAQLTNIEIDLKSDYQLRIWEQLFAFTIQFMGIKSC